MSRLIDREKIKIALCNICRPFDGFCAKGTCTAIDVINLAPTVDAVEVVRCKDCRFAEEAYCRDGKISRTEIYCVWHDERHENNYYCASGERKEE